MPKYNHSSFRAVGNNSTVPGLESQRFAEESFYKVKYLKFCDIASALSHRRPHALKVKSLC